MKPDRSNFICNNTQIHWGGLEHPGFYPLQFIFNHEILMK